MKPLLSLIFVHLCVIQTFAADASPADHLPPHITQIASFGERADWSHDGKRILFLSKTFGDAMEIDLATRSIRNLTAHYPHHGYTRALYLSNGDVLLFTPLHVHGARIVEADETRVSIDVRIAPSDAARARNAYAYIPVIGGEA